MDQAEFNLVKPFFRRLRMFANTDYKDREALVAMGVLSAQKHSILLQLLLVYECYRKDILEEVKGEFNIMMKEQGYDLDFLATLEGELFGGKEKVNG